MAQAEKASLRAEFATRKCWFEHRCAAGQLGGEGRARVEALLLLFELMLAVFMERRTRKNSQNSSLTSTRTDKTRRRPGQRAVRAPHPRRPHPQGRDRHGRSRHHLRPLWCRSQRRSPPRAARGGPTSTSSSRRSSATSRPRAKPVFSVGSRTKGPFRRIWPVPGNLVPDSWPNSCICCSPICGCFRTFQFDQAFCRVARYLQSMAFRGYNLSSLS